MKGFPPPCRNPLCLIFPLCEPLCIGPPIRRSIGPPVRRSIGPLVHWTSGQLVHQSVDPSIHLLLARHAALYVDRSVGTSFNHFLIIFNTAVHSGISLSSESTISIWSNEDPIQLEEEHQKHQRQELETHHLPQTVC